MDWDCLLENWLNASGVVSSALAEGEREQIKAPCLPCSLSTQGCLLAGFSLFSESLVFAAPREFLVLFSA